MDQIYQNSKILLNNYNINDNNTRIETYSRNKSLNSYLENKEDKFKDKLEIKPYLITLNHNPREILSGEAWNIVEEDRLKVLNKLLEEDSIIYALSAIEIHTGGKKISKKDKEELDKKISENIIINKKKGKSNKKSKVGVNSKDKIKVKGIKRIQEMYIDIGKKVISELGKIINFSEFHNKLLEEIHKDNDLNYDNKYWDDNIVHDKIRLVLEYYNKIKCPEVCIKNLNILFGKDEDNIPREWLEAIDKYRFIPDEILSLEGYPHMHIAIGVICKDGEYLNHGYISNKLMELSSMTDIRTDEKKKHKSYLGSISYTLKNHKLGIVKTKLKSAIIKGYVRLNSISEDLKEMSIKRLARNKTSKMIEMELKYVKSVVVPMSSMSKYEQVISYIISKMEEGGYKLCDNIIFKKREGSKMSYERYMRADEFYDNITKVARIQRFANKNRKEILIRMCSEDKKIEGITEMSGIKIEFPKIKFDCDNVWIECKDFFYSVITGKIVRNNSKYYSYHYCNWLSLDILEGCLLTYSGEGIWTKIILNSGLNVGETCSEMYRLIALPQVPKGKVWHGMGDSNSGKSSLLKPFLNLFPPHQIGTINSNIGRFDLYSVKDKAIIQMEEISPYDLDREDGLKLLGREPVKVEQKHGSSDRSIIRGRQIYTSNTEKDTEDRLCEGLGKTLMEISAYDNRIVNVKFDVIREVLVKASTEILNETALVVIMCGYYYYIRKEFDGDTSIDMFKIIPIYNNTKDIEEDIKGEMEYYKGFYEGTNEMPTVIKENWEWIEEHARTDI